VRALLLLRQDDDQRYQDALAILDASRYRLLPPSDSSMRPVLTGDRQRRLVSMLSVAYSQAGRERCANELVAQLLGLETTDFAVWRRWRIEDWQRHVANAPDIRAADQLGNISVRASRLALLDVLADTRTSRRNAKSWLDIAQRTGEVSLSKRHTPHGLGISRSALLVVELYRAMLQPLADGRKETLEALLPRVWDFVVESHAVRANGRANLMSRHAMYGQALMELVRCSDAVTASRRARLACVAMRPMVATQELDSSYDTHIGLFYGDACAASRQAGRAHSAWKRSLTRLVRSRPERTDVVEVIKRRMTG
jgi:hypothetical protein